MKKKLLLEFNCLVFLGCLVSDVHKGETQEQGYTRVGYMIVLL